MCPTQVHTINWLNHLKVLTLLFYHWLSGLQVGLIRGRFPRHCDKHTLFCLHLLCPSQNFTRGFILIPSFSHCFQQLFFSIYNMQSVMLVRSRGECRMTEVEALRAPDFFPTGTFDSGWHGPVWPLCGYSLQQRILFLQSPTTLGYLHCWVNLTFLNFKARFFTPDLFCFSPLHFPFVVYVVASQRSWTYIERVLNLSLWSPLPLS